MYGSSQESFQDRRVCTFHFLGKKTDCGFFLEREREVGNGITVYQGCNVSKNRNYLVSGMFHDIESTNTIINCVRCCSILNCCSVSKKKTLQILWLHNKKGKCTLCGLYGTPLARCAISHPFGMLFFFIFIWPAASPPLSPYFLIYYLFFF